VRLSKTDEECGSLLDIEWNHNHPINSLHALSFKEIPTAVIEIIKDMFPVDYYLEQHIKNS
jgi:hypothetical protein